MYKQCFELLTAQGPKPQKSFSVSTGPSEVLKEYDAALKSNIFRLQGQRIQLPPNPSQQHADFHNTGSTGTKKVGVAASLNVVHQFLVFQMFVPEGEPFAIELHVRDKHNARRRLMVSDGAKAVVTNQMHARVPNSLVARDRWINLCIDVNSFIRECFTRTGAPHMTPQTQANVNPLLPGQKPAGGGSGDMAALHSGKVGDISGTHISKAAAFMAKNAQQNANNALNSMKTIEVIQLEGNFKIRKIFTSRSQIPADLASDSPFSGGNNLLTTGTMRAEDIIQAAMVGQRIENIPKNFEFGPQVERLNQVLSYETVMYHSNKVQKQSTPSEQDAMMVTGLRMTAATNGSMAFQPATHQELSPQETYQVQNGPERSSYGGNSSNAQSNYLAPGGFKGANSSALKGQAFRVGSNDRKSSVGGDSNQPSDGGGLVINQLNSSFRKNMNTSKQTQGSVVVVDQDERDVQRQGKSNSGLRNSNNRQFPQNGPKHMKIQTNGLSNATGDTIFKQANSTTSNHGKSSQQTQSTAYSVRTTSSGRQNKGKVAAAAVAPQSPHRDNNSSGSAFNRKRSQHANSGRPVYEQVDEADESGSGVVNSLHMQDQLNSAVKGDNSSSPHFSNAQGAQQVAQSAKVKRKGIPKARVETQLPKSMDKLQSLKNQDVNTPKLHQLQEVHKTTILEENETLRGSIDRHPGSKLSIHPGGSQSNAKKYQRVQQAEAKGQAQLSAAGTRKGATGGAFTGAKNRTKSSVGGQTIQEQASSTANSMHPLMKNRTVNQKVSVSSTNLDDSIGGIVGNKIQSRQNGTRKQAGQFKNNAVSPNIQRKQALPKNQLQLSSQKRRNDHSQEPAPQFKVRNGKHQTPSHHNNGAPNQAAQFIYHGSGYTSTAQAGVNSIVDSEGEQSDFKTTTLRFTNNNFINNQEQQRRERDSSQPGQRDHSNGAQYQNQGFPQSSLLNTLSSQNNAVSQHIQQQQSTGTKNRQGSFQRNSKQFGTSDNFKATVMSSNQGAEQRTTDNFSRLQTHMQAKSPSNQRQFSTMHGVMQSEGGAPQDDPHDKEEEEQIEEDICDQGESPLINAQTKQATGHKAKALFQNHQPPLFRSTESERFNLDTMMTGFGNIKVVNPSGARDNATPFQDKSSVLASKPYLGGKPRHQLIRSPERSNTYPYEFNSAGGASELRQGIEHRGADLDKDIEEDIVGAGHQDDSTFAKEPLLREGGPLTQSKDVDPNETCTSDFYQVPIQGGIPVQLTIENGRRPFTPPFAQLVKVNKPTSGQSVKRSMGQAGNKKPPEWVSAGSVSQHQASLRGEQKSQVQQVMVIQEGDEEPIEEEIIVAHDGKTSPVVARKNSKRSEPQVSNKATTKDSSSSNQGDIKASRNQQREPHHTFAEEQIIEYTESFKRKEGVTVALNASLTHKQDSLEPSGSNSHTFGRRSRAQQAADEEDYEDDYEEDELQRHESKPHTKSGAQPVIRVEEQNEVATDYHKDVIDPKTTVDQKKRLLYDKSLKAYYDPETGQYFEMKAQLINQGSLGQLAAPTE